MINLSEEFKDFIDRKNWDHAIIRYLQPIKCFCRSKEAGLAKADCYNCEGSGYKFTEKLSRLKTFYTPRMVAHAQAHEHSITYKNILVGYFSAIELNDDIKIGDKIFQIKTNLDGSIKDPIIREREWVINDVYDMNMDGGKREFIKIHAKPVLT